MSLHTEMKRRPANWLFSKTLFFFKNGSIEIRIAKFNDGLSEKKNNLVFHLDGRGFAGSSTERFNELHDPLSLCSEVMLFYDNFCI